MQIVVCKEKFGQALANIPNDVITGLTIEDVDCGGWAKRFCHKKNLRVDETLPVFSRLFLFSSLGFSFWRMDICCQVYAFYPDTGSICIHEN